MFFSLISLSRISCGTRTCLFKVNDRNTRKICSKITKKIGVLVSFLLTMKIINFFTNFSVVSIDTIEQVNAQCAFA